MTFIELVFAIGLLFVAAGGVMSIIIAGAGMPTKAQQTTRRDALAKILLEEQVSGGVVPTGGFMDVPGNSDFLFQVTNTTSAFDSGAFVVQVEVQGPLPTTSVSTLRTVITIPPPAGSALEREGETLYGNFGCTSCHASGGEMGPDITHQSLRDNRDAESAALGRRISLDAYITESIRDPNAFGSSGWATGIMGGYPTADYMTDAQLNAIKAYLKSL